MQTMIRCAIYTRCASGGENDARREGEAYVRQRGREGMVSLSARYDDPGASGRSLLRPGLARLIRDIADGKVDYVIAHDAARLSRDSAEFVNICNYFAKHGVKLAFYASLAECTEGQR
jgi:DNA invertase Pin-like site-specific DNA recombinase